jgi:hypothetical protein
MDDPDTWFYPSEIGFICEDYAATSTPTVSVGELNASGAVVSKTNLVNAVPLTAIDGSHQRIVLATNIKKGIRGMIFSIDTAAQEERSGGVSTGRASLSAPHSRRIPLGIWPARRFLAR